MTKSALVIGMKVKLRNGNEYTYGTLLNEMAFVRVHGHMGINSYNEDLTHKDKNGTGYDWDVVEVDGVRLKGYRCEGKLIKEELMEEARLMIGQRFGCNDAITHYGIKVFDIVKFVDNDLYTWQTWLVMYSIRTCKFYLHPYNFDGKPISITQEYLGCDGRMHKNGITKVGKV